MQLVVMDEVMQAIDHQIDRSGERSNYIWPIRLVLYVKRRYRPHMGWGVVLMLALLSMLPAVALRMNRWVLLGDDQIVLETIGPLSVLTMWLVSGWRRPRQFGRKPRLTVVLRAAAVLVIGALVISQATMHWIPGPLRIYTSAVGGEIGSLPNGVVDDWSNLIARFSFWWAGVAAGSSAQDNLIFLTVAGAIVWLFGSLSAMLARKYQSGLLAAMPILWLLGSILLYSSTGRLLFVFALGLSVALHFLIDHEEMLSRWRRAGFDYSGGLFLDRVMLVLGATLLILTLAAVTPNLYVQVLVDSYYAQMRPQYEAMEDAARRLFPGVRGTSRLGGGRAGGLPNEFLLRAGPELTDTVVMYVRTNEAAPSEYPYEMIAPPGHYMRGGTLSVYDGRGWRNPVSTERTEHKANTRIAGVNDVSRKELVQHVALEFSTQVLYAAAEPAELSADSRVEYRVPGDIVAVWGRDKSYTAVSYAPAVSEEALREAASWSDGNPLPEAYREHLDLPETVTQRTLDLASYLTANEQGLYAKAHAIESHLRTLEYDLEVPGPPEDVEDVADYFLFELQRGYCDYYATSFVVLARAAGIPARFATGFAAGSWNPEDGIWTITEAEAHSWPEVYFPEYGWIPFEPTAGRAELERIGLPQTYVGGASSTPIEETESSQDAALEWNWQMLFWLTPLGLLLWGLWHAVRFLRRRNEDPWLSLVDWGGGAGRPMHSGETILEYGDGLADYVLVTQTQRQDLARVAAAEMRSLSSVVSSGRYAPERERDALRPQVERHWNTLREYLRPLRRSRWR